MIFTYKARDKSGAVVTGEVSAGSIKQAQLNLAGRGLFPISVKKGSGKLGFNINIFTSKNAKAKELISITRQFSALFKAGITIDRILLTVSKQAKSAGMRDALTSIRMDVMSGTSLMTAFGKFPRYFDDLYVSMLGAGEEGGILDKTLADLSEILKRQYAVRADIKSATLYPKIVIGAFLLAVAVIMTKVIPAFADYYSSYGGVLPLPTRIVMAVSNFTRAYWPVVVGAASGFYFIFKAYKKTKNGALRIDALRFKIPIFGRLNKLVVNARFGRMVSALYRSGLPLGRTLDIAGGAIGNKAIEVEISKMSRDLELGSSLAGAVEKRKYFDPLIVESISTGEQSGALDEMLDGASIFFDEEVDNLVGQLTTLLEPLMLVGLFGMVALLALAVFLPMWQLNTLILQKE